MDKLLEAINEYQAHRQLTDGQFSQLVELDPSTLSKIKSGHRSIGVGTLKAIARIPELRVKVISYIIGSDGDTPNQGGIIGQVKRIFRR